MNLFQVVILFASTLVTDVARGLVHSSHSHQCDICFIFLKKKKNAAKLKKTNKTKLTAWYQDF